jgi:glucuronosyltransferase
MLLACVNLVTLPVNSAHILAVETVCGKSHWNFMSGVLRPLVGSGHTITAFTPFPDGDRENYTEVDISGCMNCFRDKDLKGMIANRSNSMAIISKFASLSRELCDTVYADDRMIEVLRRNGTSYFDLVIIETLTSECVSYVATILNVPVIYVTPLSKTSMIEQYITGHFSNPAVISHALSDNDVPTTFIQRMVNAALLVYGLIYNDLTVFRLRWSNPNPYDLVLLSKPSLVFVNSHPVITTPSPGVTNIINVGGIHLTVAKSLPQVRNIHISIYK